MMKTEEMRSFAQPPQIGIGSLPKARIIDGDIRHAPWQNHLLAALPAFAYERLAPCLELVHMPLCDVLYESGDELHDVYFPTTAIVSLLCVTENGTSSEIAGVGNEGVIGVALLMGGSTMPTLAVVLHAGFAYRLEARLLKEEFRRTEERHTGALQNLLLRYTQTLMTQISQVATCNRHHSVEKQLCRWLLLNLDRSPANQLTIAQELIAGAFGIRHEIIAEAAEILQHAGLVGYRSGHITVLDRYGLENRACECYHVVKTEFDRLFPDVTATRAAALKPVWRTRAITH